ncbi:innexin unc-9 isoform X2 [Lingula anatina]|uniref:Innexin n=1 Tax=Lingula anatina TaxID=7574 RepID=A0A1S3JYL9_LINAN|nr:innexin unc-9 isoform X2 [Lingula anatina]|eukprot:XP_013415387.1 innexin unc-9 isoform X2 [Lingula anatina]
MARNRGRADAAAGHNRPKVRNLVNLHKERHKPHENASEAHAAGVAGLALGFGMSGFLDVLGKVGKGLRSDDDFFDRLSHRYTAIIFIVFALVVSTKQYVGDPITCWTPTHFTDAHEDYTNNYCWIKNTYYTAFDERIPEKWEPHEHIGYYQWVPIVLMVQALMFYIPCIVWRLLNGRTGVDMNTIVKSLSGNESLNPDAREGTIRYLVRHLDRYFDHQRDLSKGCFANCKQLISKHCICLFCGRRYGNYLIALYLIIKVIYLANVIGQLFLLNAFLGTNYHIYGFEVIGDLMNKRSWKESGQFPRVTLCDFEIRFLGGVSNIHRHTVQCVLPINLFNEKIYIFIWFWLVFVSAATVFGFLTWLSMLFQRERRHYIRKYLKLMERIESNCDTKMTHAFIEKYLRQDGVFILKLLGRNTNDVVVAEMIDALWEYFTEQKRNIHPGNGTEIDV